MPGVDVPDGAGSVNLYWADRGQFVWASAGGIYITEISTGATRRLLDNPTTGFGSIIGFLGCDEHLRIPGAGRADAVRSR